MRYSLTTLKKDIKDLEENIADRKKAGIDYSFEKKLLQSWRTYLPGGRNNYKLSPDAPQSMRKPLK